jgi:predicted TIM-barrel fold metal-dependent hydrolase
MVIDCHVHISACTPGHGYMSPRLLGSVPFRFMRWQYGLKGTDEAAERKLAETLVSQIDQTPGLDAAVVLAFDQVYDATGQPDAARTHLYVSNDYVIELTARYPKMLLGASVHPYRRDAINELERCVKAGAVLLKWLPNVQGIDPSSPRCFEFYDALAHHGLPLLCHTGGEKALPQLNPEYGNPLLLRPALERGVTVIAAHCGTRSWVDERDHLADFVHLAHEHERLYGDTSALNMPTRSHAWRVVLEDPVVRAKLVHGSDWPILPVPPASILGWGEALRLLRDPNWLRRDLLIKKKLGLGDEYWNRAATILRLPSAQRGSASSCSPTAASSGPSV